MTRTMIAFISMVALVVASSSAGLGAQGKKGSAQGPQHVSSKGKVTSPKAPSGPKTTAGPKASGPKTTSVSQTSKGPKNTTVKAAGKMKTTSSPETRAAKVDAKNTTKTVRVDANNTTSTVDTPPVTLTRVQEQLQKNTRLADRLESRLTRGTDLMEAADGFRNLGQFVAAVNVSSNLGIDFERLKIAMVDDGRSLGQAIQTVKRDVENPTLVAERAETEALTLIRQTENRRGRK